MTDGLLPGLITNPKGGLYSLIDRGAFPGETYRYILVEVERDGKKIVYGPFSVFVGTSNIAGFKASEPIQCRRPAREADPEFRIIVDKRGHSWH